MLITARGDPAKVLIVEDSPTQAELIRSLLEEHGFDVRLARHGREALSLALIERPHLIIADVVMPEMDGYQLCRSLKADPELREIPLVLVTNLTDPRDIIEGINCGADNFITKPYDENYLLARIDYLLANRLLRGSSKLSAGLRIELGGRTHLITAEREQMLDVLMSVYAEAARYSDELRASAASLREANATLELLHRSASALNRARGESDVIAAALESCASFEFIRGAWIILLDDAGKPREFAATGLPDRGMRPVLPERCPCHTALLSGENPPIAVVDRCEMLALLTPGYGRHEHAAAPLISGDRRLGVLCARLGEDRAFAPHELDVISTLASQVSGAIYRATLYETLERAFAERTAQLRIEIDERTRAEALMRDAIESVAGGIALFDAEERLVVCNKKYRDLYPEVGDVTVPGTSFEELLRAVLARGQYAQISGEPNKESWRNRILAQFRSCEGSFESRLKSGQIVLVSHRRMANGWTAALRIDITETRKAQLREKELEQQLAHAQKMEAIGNLTGGMAHDFNNLLGIIVGNLGLLQRRIEEDAESKELVEEALAAAWQGADLTRSLLAFARKQPLHPARLDVNQLIAQVAKLLGRILGEHIEIVLDTAGTPTWPIIADAAQLEASLVNLAVNARDAMPNGGRLIIAATNKHIDEVYGAANSVGPGEYALISVTDTGIGMTQEVLARVFEPFFTTKEIGKGTGLGLSMVFGFIKQSNGHISVYSEPGHGTTFRLYLPRAAEEAGASAAASGSAKTAQSETGETVLVIEDNASLRQVVMRQLRRLGYRALESDAKSALDLIERERINLLFTDVVMPGGVDGIKLARQAIERYPKLKVLLTSGFPQNKYGESAPNFQLLSKPYSTAELSEALRAVLDGG